MREAVDLRNSAKGRAKNGCVECECAEETRFWEVRGRGIPLGVGKLGKVEEMFRNAPN